MDIPKKRRKKRPGLQSQKALQRGFSCVREWLVGSGTEKAQARKREHRTRALPEGMASVRCGTCPGQNACCNQMSGGARQRLEKRGDGHAHNGSGTVHARKESAQQERTWLCKLPGIHRDAGIAMLIALEKYQEYLVTCPICGKPVVLAPVLEKRTGTVRLGLTCARNCFPRDLYTCAQENDKAAKLVRRWHSEIVPAIEKWKGVSQQSPRCPHCDKPTRLLPVPEKNGTLVMRPVCVQQGCRLPAQWHFSPTK